jgi:hypothetical protein
MVKGSLLAAAALLVFSVVTFWMIMAPQSPSTLASFRLGPHSAFTLTHVGKDASPSGNFLSKGSRLRLTRGTMEGVFESGVRCVIEAPCDVMVLAGDRVSVAEGVAWFEVPSKAARFTVETPRFTAVDLGTEFGVVARAGGEHELHVAKGSVELRAGTTGEAVRKLVLKAGQARRVDAGGEWDEIPVDSGHFTTVLPQAVFIVNHSFEVDRNEAADGFFTEGPRRSFGGELTGWTSQSGNDRQAQVGWRDIKPQELDPYPAPSNRPAQALTLMSGASLLNVTGTPWSSMRAGDRLTLTVALGMRDGSPELAWNEATFFGLTDGNFRPTGIPNPADTVTHSGLIAFNPATGNRSGDGTFRDISIDYTISETDLRRPGHIGILLVGSGSNPGESTHQSFFDNVRIHVR